MRLLSHLAVLGAAAIVFVLVCPSTRVKRKLIKGKQRKEHRQHGISSLRATSKITLSKLSQMTALSGQQPSQRLKLILYIGPSGITETMALERELTGMTSLLTSDHYTYQGRQYNSHYTENGELVENPIVPPLLQEARAMFTDCRLAPRSLCCDKFQQQLAKFKKKKQNVIVSDDSFNRLWKSPEDYHAMQEALQNDWDVTVVVGYQRFYDWILSYKNADHLLLPLFSYLEGYHWQFPFSNSAIANARDSFPVELLSVYSETTVHDNSIGNRHHHNTSMTSNFVCRILKDAPNTCKGSSLRGEINNEIVPFNKASMFYDALAGAALIQGFSLADGYHNDLQPMRQQVLANAIQEHHERVLGKTYLEFEFVCPSADDLEQLLHYSLQLEEDLLPDEFVDMEEEHVAGFQSLVSSKAYCSLDTKTILREKEWQEFFLQYSKAASFS